MCDNETLRTGLRNSIYFRSKIMNRSTQMWFWFRQVFWFTGRLIKFQMWNHKYCKSVQTGCNHNTLIMFYLPYLLWSLHSEPLSTTIFCPYTSKSWNEKLELRSYIPCSHQMKRTTFFYWRSTSTNCQINNTILLLKENIGCDWSNRMFCAKKVSGYRSLLNKLSTICFILLSKTNIKILNR